MELCGEPMEFWKRRTKRYEDTKIFYNEIKWRKYHRKKTIHNEWEVKLHGKLEGKLKDTEIA